MINRVQQIKSKGFKMDIIEDEDSTFVPNEFSSVDDYVPIDYSKIRVGLKTLKDAVIDLNTYKKLNTDLGDKEKIQEAIAKGNFSKMRQISDFFFRTSGIYRRLCVYLAYLYRYDWMVTPYIIKKASPDKLVSSFSEVLYYLDESNIKDILGDIALKVVKDGCYYGYVIDLKDKFIIQELSPDYCRSRFKIGARPAVEFNLKYFDDTFRDVQQRMRVIELFPPEFKKAYQLYKTGKLEPDFQGDSKGWYLLDPEAAIKFNLNESDYPMLMSVIPAIVDLDEAKGLDKKKMQQQLLRILIQKLPMDKNGELIFDVEEGKELHNNAVKMLQKSIGVDVLTTFADVSVEDMSDNRKSTATDDLERVERAVYNEGGISQMQFNTDGNIALEKSILNDEASIYNLIVQFQDFLNYVIKKFNVPKKVRYKLQILSTTIYNYKDLSKMYKEQMQIGYSKMLAQIALGQSQSSILANAHFENEVLDLINLFIPPLQSSVMNGDVLQNRGGGGSTQDKTSSEDSQGGRPPLDDDKKSEKTIQNKESAN